MCLSFFLLIAVVFVSMDDSWCGNVEEAVSVVATCGIVVVLAGASFIAEAVLVFFLAERRFCFLECHLLW